ncbi:ABC transporter ATP-binding protein [Pyxidicoccus sp. MSG2]|uniref:ABC transporter ATP-binding protein n=1 Tax=Pyxidicoccus sp. MSG2 TaxID=2996790 RepID=UPI0022704893|nr:ABC transporter ATP-binding protein [Pyxidicoccus sp. MSG2]MCY1020931.1 ABC transporter ATP-binding protein [Pyxidicoccus sp. MSG2]
MSGIHVEGLGKRFGDRTAVEGLSFHVRPGEVFGLLGPNGAGKTTTVRMLTGLLSPSEGEATVWGHRVDRDGESLRKVVGLLTEQPGLYDRLTARENLRFFMKLHELDEAKAWPRAQDYLRRFGLGGRDAEPVGGFSKGMRQKLAIVRTLVHDPQVIFLDEPTSGLDPESARTVRDAVAELASEGRTIVLCSHNLSEVERLCERVGVVKRRLLAIGPVRELRRSGQALDVRVDGEAERFLNVLTSLPFAPNVLAEGARLRVMLADEAHAPDVLACLVGAGARVHSAVPAQRPLEEVYLDLLQEGRG